MKLFECYSISHEDPVKFGINWFGLREGPFMRIDKPDEDYYEGFHISLYFLNTNYCFNFRTKKLPYRNKEEYFVWLKKERRRKV